MEDEANVLNAGPGRELQAAREKLNFTREEVAARLKLSPRFILAMEEDNYSNGPHGPFTRGYLRAYARFLGLSAVDILNAYDALQLTQVAPQIEYAQIPPIARIQLNESPKASRPWLLLTALFGGILIGVYANNQPLTELGNEGEEAQAGTFYEPQAASMPSPAAQSAESTPAPTVTPTEAESPEPPAPTVNAAPAAGTPETPVQKLPSKELKKAPKVSPLSQTEQTPEKMMSVSDVTPTPSAE